MSGIHNLGEYHLKAAIERFDNEHYEGTTGCSHVMDEKGNWLLNERIEQKVVAHNERDCFGPGEVHLLCLDCNREAEKEEWTCDWCHHRGTDVSGLTDHETHEEYMVCSMCRDIDRAETEVDLCYDYYEFDSPAERKAAIEKAKAEIVEIRKKRDERKAKEEAEHKTPQ